MTKRALFSLLALAGCPMKPGTTTPSGGTMPVGEPGRGPEDDGTGGGAAPSPAPGPATPTTVSVTIRSSCKDTVKVFFGDKPKFGSGRYSTVSSNSVSSSTFGVGDMLWIVDDGQNGVASATIAATTRELEITSSCSGFTGR